MNKTHLSLSAIHSFKLIVLLICSSWVAAETYVVTRVDDPIPDGCTSIDCSLREAVLAANSNSGMDQINLNLTTYVLNRVGQDEVAALGDLDITDDLTVIGQFVSIQPLSITEINAANLQDRVFDVKPGVSFDLEHVLLKDADAGLADGGGIKSMQADISLYNVHIMYNRADSGAGLFAVDSHVNLDASYFGLNTATYRGGAVLLQYSTLDMNDSWLQENFAEIGGGLSMAGFADENTTPAIQIKDSQITHNYAESVGGGLSISADFLPTPGSQTVVLSRVKITSNESKRGAGIYHSSGDLIGTELLISNNLAFNPSMNSDAIGAGLYFGNLDQSVSQLSISHALFYNNQSVSTHTTGRAAALYIKNHQAQITNSTFSQNAADQYAALEISAGELTLINNTLAFNDSANLFDLRFAPGTTTTLQNNILADRCLIFGITQVNSLGGNIETPGDTCGLGQLDLYGSNRRDLIDADLEDHGGFTATHAIEHYQSDAIGFAIPLINLTTDQRLAPRDGSPDSGAFEVQPGELNVIFENGFD